MTATPSVRHLQKLDELSALAFGWTAVPRQRRELIADALERFGDRRRELAQVAAQPRRETKGVVGARVGPVTQLQILQHSHRVVLRRLATGESVEVVALSAVCAGSQNASPRMRCVSAALQINELADCL